MFKRLIPTIGLVACIAIAFAAVPSWAQIRIEHNKNENLDGAVVVGPGAEHITSPKAPVTASWHRGEITR